MKIYMETTLERFDAWSGGEDTLEVIREKGFCDTLEAHIECDIFPDGCTDTELNDFLWFERDFIAELLGFSDWEALENDGEEEEEEEEDCEFMSKEDAEWKDNSNFYDFCTGRDCNSCPYADCGTYEDCKKRFALEHN